MALSHYLNQCWLIITVRSEDIHLEEISWEMTKPPITENELENNLTKNVPKANELKCNSFSIFRTSFDNAFIPEMNAAEP